MNIASPSSNRMKLIQSSARAALALILASGGILSLVSCVRHFTLTSPAQLSQLPVSRGLNGGSYVAATPWQYRGSHYGTHEFFYFYHTDNELHRREVSINRRSAVLHFREVIFGSQLQWVTLCPDSTAFEFYLHRPRRQ